MRWLIGPLEIDRTERRSPSMIAKSGKPVTLEYVNDPVPPKKQALLRGSSILDADGIFLCQGCLAHYVFKYKPVFVKEFEQPRKCQDCGAMAGVWVRLMDGDFRRSHP